MSIKDEEDCRENYEDSYEFVLESYGANTADDDNEIYHLDDILSEPLNNNDSKPIQYPKRNDSFNAKSIFLSSYSKNINISREKQNRLDCPIVYPQNGYNSHNKSTDHTLSFNNKIQKEENSPDRLKESSLSDPEPKPLRFNPFIITEQDLITSNLSILELVPQEIAKKKKLFEKKSKYKDIIEQREREQLQAQLIFRNEFSLPPPQGSPLKEIISKRYSSDDGRRSSKAVKQDESTSIIFAEHEAREERFRAVKQDESTSIIITEHEAREERLRSLGIFELFPKCTTTIHSQQKLYTFKTPAHHKPIKLEEDIVDITNPVLVGTTSQIYTVPISEIIKDLKAAGRYLEDDFGDSKKKKGFFK